ncbi:hypothetical protein CXG81DRAFT_24516 [Caulochytrium protostelioides]|uniref:Uncharacterized protein n=1 Tax=Caulochytrium protostelioides TaxID=1555241 RepID=A0A4P9XBL8_9FUNG|nr:hypothetical protein CXG81DRAFT_24516 [Caulochytrium protostelioides]|eukprot:RKP02817.1 hypothetical protein CXG81DRAFT_24516 [Caulochytrium protostelioides]
MASSLTPLAIGHGGHDRHHDAPTAGRPSLDPPGSDFDWQAIAQLQTSGVGDDQSIAEWEHRLNQLLPNLTQGVLRPGENHATDDNIRQLVQVLQTALELKTAILADTEAELAQSQDVLTQRARRKSDRDEDDDAAFDRELQRVEVERDEADARYQATLQQLQTERERQSQTEALRRQLLEENAALRDQMMSLKERLAVVTNAPLSPVDHSHAQHDRATIAALETEIRALTEQNSEWEAEHVRLLEELMAVMDHFEQSQAEQRRLAQAVVEGDELLTQMGKDRSHLKHQLQHLSAQIQSRGQMDDSLLTDIQRELLKSQSQLAFYKDLVAQKDEALVAAQAAQTEIQQALSSSQTTQLRAEIAARDQEIKHLHREFAVQQHDFALLAEEWDHLVQREEGAVTDSAQSRHASSLISRLRTQNERQKTAIAKLLRNLRHARQTLVDREGEFLKHMRVAGRGEVQALRSEIMTLRDEAMTLQKQYHTAMDLLAEKDLLLAHLDTADLAQFEQAVQRAVAAHQPVQMACDSAAYLDAASEPLREALAQAQRRNQQLKDKLAKASPRPEPEPAIPGLDPAKVEALFLCLSDRLESTAEQAKATQRDPSSPGSERPPLPEQTAHMRAIRAQLQAQVHRAVALQAQLEAQQRQRTDEVARLRHELERETEQGCQLDRARRQLQNEQNVLQQEVETLTGTTATLRERLSARGIARSRHQLMKAQQRLRASQRQTATLQECLQLTKERLDAVTDWFTVTMPTIPGTPLVPVADRDPKLLEYPLPEATS